MKYMLLIYGAEDSWTEDERTRCMLDSMQVCDELDTQGKWLGSSPLYPVVTATCVRVRNGQRQVTDGPYAETTEQLGGYYIIDVDSLDEAVDIASQIPPVKKGTVEIRPLLPIPDSFPAPELSTLNPGVRSDSKQYILLMYVEDSDCPPEQHAKEFAESRELCQELHSKGQFLGAAPLEPPSAATCVRVRNGKRTTVAGSFPETKEQLGSCFLIDVPNLDEAILVASRIPCTRRGTAEIRPLFPLPERPAS